MLKRSLFILGTLLLVLVAAVTVHVYLVTRVRPPDDHTRILARMDFPHRLTAGDSTGITAWLYGRKGVDHVLCNPAGKLVIFSFFAKKTSAGTVVNDFNASFAYHATRHLPTEAEMTMGCPFVSGSPGYRMYLFFKHLF
ncbi:MAG TPA: hypothetical protein VGS79_07845 [Puia sp.]|nr:hypothetical protein [Puia sp.]